MRQVIMYQDEDGYWIVEFPSLKGCVSQDRTKSEALTNILVRLQVIGLDTNILVRYLTKYLPTPIY